MPKSKKPVNELDLSVMDGVKSGPNPPVKLSEIDKLIRNASYMATLQNQIDQARGAFLDRCNYAVHGGLFTITPEWLAYLHLYMQAPAMVRVTPLSVVLLDRHQIPVRVPDIEAFYMEVYQRYHEALNQFSDDYNRISQARTIPEVLEMAK